MIARDREASPQFGMTRGDRLGVGDFQGGHRERIRQSARVLWEFLATSAETERAHFRGWIFLLPKCIARTGGTRHEPRSSEPKLLTKGPLANKYVMPLRLTLNLEYEVREQIQP